MPPPGEGAPADITIFRRTFNAPNADYLRLGIGQLVIATRRAEQPTSNIQRLRVAVQRDSEPIIRRDADSLGVVHFDSLPAGTYRVINAYAPVRLTVAIEPGCRTDVEMYWGVRFIGIAPPGSMTPRVTITTCPEPEKR